MSTARERHESGDCWPDLCRWCLREADIDHPDDDNEDES